MTKKNLGRSIDQMYPSAIDGKREHHPEVIVPSDMMTRKYSIGDKVNVEFEGVIESMDKNTHRLKLLKGGECDPKSEEESETTLLGKK